MRALKIKLNPAGPRPNLNHSKALNTGSGTQHEPCPGLRCKLNVENKATVTVLKGKTINGPCCGFSQGHKGQQPSFHEERSAHSNQTSRKGKKLIVPTKERDLLSLFKGEKWHLIHLPVCDAGQRQLFQRDDVWATRAVPPAPSAVVPTSTGTAGPQHRSPMAAHCQ